MWTCFFFVCRLWSLKKFFFTCYKNKKTFTVNNGRGRGGEGRGTRGEIALCAHSTKGRRYTGKRGGQGGIEMPVKIGVSGLEGNREG